MSEETYQVVAFRGPPSQRQAWLARRRPHARQLYAHRLQVDDVIHAPSGPLEVVAAPVTGDGGVTSVVVLDYHEDGAPYEREVVLSGVKGEGPRTVLTSRPSAVPVHLRDPEWVAPTS